MYNINLTRLTFCWYEAGRLTVSGSANAQDFELSNRLMVEKLQRQTQACSH